MKFLTNKQPGLDMRAALNKKGRSPVMCAISYIGANATEYLPLKKGDILVCDAEIVTVKQGSTVPESLDTFHRKGVKIYSRPGLHAKVVAGARTAWIGSANASESSSRKIEASVRTTDANIVKEVKEFVTELIDFPGHKLTQKKIDELLALERRKEFVRGSSVAPEKLPDSISQLKLIRFKFLKPNAKHQDIEKSSRKQALSERSKLGTKTLLEAFYISGKTYLRKDDWVILFNGQEVFSPAQVLSVHGGEVNSVCWLARPQVTNETVLQAELEKYIDKCLPPRADESTWISPYASKVVNFFRQ